MLAIRLPQDVENRLAELARATGRTKTYYAREAILRYLEDLEDIYLAEQAILESKGKPNIPLEQILAELADVED